MALFFLATSKHRRKEEDQKEEKSDQIEEGKFTNGSDIA